MNRLRMHKLKITSSNSAHQNNISNNNNNDNNVNSNGLIHKITKRYFTFSNKVTRRNHAFHKNPSSQKLTSGNYNMTGENSEDHRPEIGAPVLISTTTFDADDFNINEARLNQIERGVATKNNMITNVPVQCSPQIPSSGSENEMYVDALSTPVPQKIMNNITDGMAVSEEKFEIAYNPKEIDQYRECYATSPETSSSSFESKKEEPNLLNSCNDKINSKSLGLSKKGHSKSVQNLHCSENNVKLQKAPSTMVNVNISSIDLDHNTIIPKLPELVGNLGLLKSDIQEDKENCISLKTNVMATQVGDMSTSICTEQKVTKYLSQQQRFKSIDSLDIQRQRSQRRSLVFCSDTSINQESSIAGQCSIEDFDLKSVSCQSLNAENLFVSIEELNEITRQIKESEDFDTDNNLEYCMHRDNLKPSERRITLLKNKNTRLISLNHNKEKIKKSWSDVKHWLDEERSKLKEAVQKQPMMQKLNGSRLNISNAECRKSTSVYGSVLLRNNSRPELREKIVGDGLLAQSSWTLNTNTNSLKNNSLNCDNISEKRRNEEQQVTQSEWEEDLYSDSMQQRMEKRDSSLGKTSTGQNGFEELRRYVKQGGDFGKELILILQERVEAELLYSKSLSKMANKLNKACRDLPGSIAEAWRCVASEMENRSNVHRQLSSSFTEEIIKPLKSIIESHHKSRKSVESNVDKASRVLTEWRVSEAKSKKVSHTASRENEKLQDIMLDVRIQKSPSIALLHQGPNRIAAEKEIKSAEKDCVKLDCKRKKAEEAVKRADVEYYTLCIRAEHARVDWEMAVLRGSTLLQSIENLLLINMKNFVTNYTRITNDINPILDGVVNRLKPQVDVCNVVKDMQIVKNIRRNSEGPSEQLLPDFYCEHTTLAMNRERRKHALIKLLQLVKTDLERERRLRSGLKGLSQSLNNHENQNVTDKLHHIRSMLTYLEGARFKLHSALLELDHKPRSSHPLAQHIQVTRDRTGLQQSVLKVPLWLKNNDRVTNGNAIADDVMQNEHEYDCASEIQSKFPTTSSDNVYSSICNKGTVNRHFNRSKSNIETFSSKTQISFTNTSRSKTIQTTSTAENIYCNHRGQADGGSNQQDSDFDEFSSQDEDDTHTASSINVPKSSVGSYAN